MEEPDLEDLLGKIVFSEVEIDMVLFELDQLRSITSTSTDKYLTRVLSSVGDDGRSAFLKGFLAGAFLASQD